MSLLRLRRWSRALAVLLLVVSVRALPHLESDDLGCLPALEHHDDTRQAIRPGGVPAQADHCDVCHLTRSLRAPKPAPALCIAQITSSAPVRLDRAESPRAAVRRLLPARAPPASF